MKEYKISGVRNALLYAVSAVMGFVGGYLLPLSHGSEQTNVMLFVLEFFAPILVLSLVAFAFVVFTSLRYDLVAAATGIPCHFGSIHGANVFLPLTLVMFVSAALIGAAIGRDVRKRIGARWQPAAGDCRLEDKV